MMTARLFERDANLEELHEQDDVMTVFSPDVHTHVKPRTALLHIAVFVAAFFGIVGATQMTFTPLQANRRTYPYNGNSARSPKVRR